MNYFEEVIITHLIEVVDSFEVDYVVIVTDNFIVAFILFEKDNRIVSLFHIDYLLFSFIKVYVRFNKAATVGIRFTVIVNLEGRIFIYDVVDFRNYRFIIIIFEIIIKKGI